MTFNAYGSVSDSISVNIIDFLGPTITTKPEIPFRSGSNVVFTCMVETLSTQITFEWECLGKVEPKSRRVSMFNSTKYYSVIMRNVHVVHDGKTCRCSINVDGIMGNFDISLAISRKPIIDISKETRCESSSAVTLYCVIDTGFPLFGFNNWQHSRHGTLIRHLEGEMVHTKSILQFNSCSHDDTGDYTCEAYNRYQGNTTFANKTVSLIVYGPPIIQSEETVTCNNSSVKLTCTINTGLPVYGFNPWIHYFNGTFIRSLNGSVQEINSILEVDTCSYQNAGEYICVAWNKYGDTALIANKTIVLVVNASPMIISSDVIREQLTTLSATFYSPDETLLTWEHSNQTLTNSTDRFQTLERNTIELILYNTSIACDGYTANLSIRSSLVGIYVLLLQNPFGESRLFFEVNKLGSQDMTGYYDLRTVMFCIIAIGIFILSTAGTVIMSKGIRRKNVIHIIGPHERCPTIPIYHTAPALDNTQNEYAIPETGYLQVTNEQYELDFSQDTVNKGSEKSRYMSSNYDEIDV
ncbi:neural cell adhesion molecule 1-like [Mytilus edulis]|uniref:neural cell adhesion molecule 1-like n=1 Tax=Mytilus edulis TaxID=6550 RepID=UPI0039F09B09